MHLARLAALALAAVLAAACSGSGASPSPSQAGPSAPASADPIRIEVELTDALKIELASLIVPAGRPVTFVVRNAGSTEHEFVLGDEAEQAAHELEMAGSMGMTHDEAMGIGVKPGATKELTVTFDEPGSILAGCHIPGHYASGMKAALEVQG